MSAPNEDDIEEEYGDDFEEEPQKDEEPGKKQSGEQGGPGKAKSYTFVLLDGEDDKGGIELATDSKWSEFLAAAETKLGFPVTAINYEHDFGAAKTKSKHCKDDNEWNEVLAIMEENAIHLQGKLKVHITKAAPKKTDTVEAKPAEVVKEDASAEAAKGKSMDESSKQPVAVATSSQSNQYTFVLFEGEEEKVKVKTAHDCTWTEFLAAAKSKIGYEVGWILYDDDFGPNRDLDIKCQDQEDWEDLLTMMDEDSVHIKGELDVEVFKKPASNAGAAESKAPQSAGAVSEKASVSTPPPALTLRCFDGNTHVKDLRVQPGTTWDEILKQLAGMQNRPHSFEYKDGGQPATKIKVSDPTTWSACLKHLNANKTMDVYIITSESSIASSTKHKIGSARSTTVSESVSASMEAAHYTPATLKLSQIHENALSSVIQHREEIISACNQRDKTHQGTCSYDELAKRIRKSALCREEVAQEIAAVCQAEPGGVDAIDYALLLRRFRYGEY
jgi:hypothetical protein